MESDDDVPLILTWDEANSGLLSDEAERGDESKCFPGTSSDTASAEVCKQPLRAITAVSPHCVAATPASGSSTLVVLMRLFSEQNVRIDRYSTKSIQAKIGFV